MKSLLAVIALCMPVAVAAQDSVSSVEATCTAPEGWSAILERDPDFVVFGESHGTNEGPNFVARLLCAEARRGQRVLLAVEHSAWQNAKWQAAWALSPEQFGAILPDYGWRGRNDGVASEAMWRLVDGAHKLKQGGAAIDIVAFNGERDDAQRARFADLPGQGPHEAAQAENIAQAAVRKNYDRVIVLVGNLHAELLPLTLTVGGPEFEPMAMRLARYGSVISLAMQDGGGTAWSCRLPPDTKLAPGENVTSDMIKCTAYEDKATANEDRPPFIDISDAAADASGGRYHGKFWVGPITASPPAFPEEPRQ